MGNIPAEVSEVKSLIDKRLKSLSQVKKILTLGGDESAVILNSFVRTLSGFNAIINSTEKNFIKQELESIAHPKIREIPVAEINSSMALSVMHDKFKNLTAAIFSSDFVPDFFRDILHEGCKNTINASQQFMSDIQNVSDLVSTHALEISGYLDMIKNTPSKDLPSMLTSEGPAIIKQSQDMYAKVIKLFNNVKRTNSFNSDFISSIISDSDALIDKFISMGKSPATAAHNIQSVLGVIKELDFQAENIKSFASNTQKFGDEFRSLDLNKLLEGNFKSLLGSANNIIKQSQQAVASAKSGNHTALIQSVKNIISNLSNLKGQVSSVKEGKLKDIFNLDSTLLNDFSNLKTQADSFVNNFPNEVFRSFKADVTAVVKITEDLLKPLSMLNSKMRPDINSLLSIGDRIINKANSIISHTANFVNTLGGFSKSNNKDSQTAIAALKKSAPTPLESLMKGNVSTFKKSLDNPMLLTKIGQCQVAINDSMTKPGMTAAKLSKLNAILSFVNGEQEREVMTNFVSDLDLQKSLAVVGIDEYINEIIMPQQKLLQEYITMSGIDQ